MKGKVDVLLGLQYGDEGKGKIIDIIAKDYDIVARFSGSNNCGHTICFNDTKIVLHNIPSGIFRDNTINVIGNGCVIDPIAIMKEIKEIEALGINVKEKLIISDKAHITLPLHRYIDKHNEEAKVNNKIGTTLKGVGPAYADKASRNGFRLGDSIEEIKSKYNDYLENHYLNTDENEKIFINIYDSNHEFFNALAELKTYQILSTEHYLNNALRNGKSILAEGAQGALLDNDFGTYPFVTSCNTTVGGVLTGLGVPAQSINKVIGIVKAYTTRVGSGPFPTELNNSTGDLIRKIGNEYGSTTGRERRCGWLNLDELKYACMINGVTDLYLMKADVLNTFEKIVVRSNDRDFELDGWNQPIDKNFPQQLYELIGIIEKTANAPVRGISYGPNRDEFRVIYIGLTTKAVVNY